MGTGSNNFEAPARLIKCEQSALRNPKIGTVKTELALPFTFLDPWKTAQIGKTLDDRSQRQTLDIIFERRASGSDSRCCGADQTDPFPDEIARGKRFMTVFYLIVRESSYTAAARVSHEHNMFDSPNP